MARAVGGGASGPRRRRSSGSTQRPAGVGSATSHWYSQLGTSTASGRAATGLRPEVRSGLLWAAGRGHSVPSTAHTGRSSGSGLGKWAGSRECSAATATRPAAKASGRLGQRRRQTLTKLSRTSGRRLVRLSTASMSSNRLSLR